MKHRNAMKYGISIPSPAKLSIIILKMCLM